ncbi:MAG: prolipoprotein diacylglyceryl transferase [Phycisphaerales bacterium]|nr:MAG: prolipoprotein diacylglyceryl transferase [Phycisphaerales bacterium]
MYPRIGPVPTYGIFYFGGVLVYFLIARWLARRTGLRRRVWIVLGICYLLGMTLGAKILFDWRHSDLDFAALLTAERWTRGGLWGGMLAYLVLAIPLALLITKQRRSALDLVAWALILPWIMAKIGCFFNGCCHGKPCSLPWAVTFPEAARGAPPGVPVHPTQFYEIGIMLILLALFALLRSERWRGTKLFWFLLIYGFGRAATDFLRGEADPTFLGPLTLTQLVCACAAAVALLALTFIRPRPARERSPLS